MLRGSPIDQMPDLAAIRDAVAARKAMLAEQDTEEPSATAKAVALVGGRHGADLRHADLRISAFEDLSLMALRGLFADMPPI